MRAQALRDRQHEVSGGDTWRQRADELDADDTRQQHRDRLAEHGGFRLDAADTPRNHAEAVHHRRVRVGTHERVGIREARRVAEDDLREVLEVHLVADAAIRREHAQRLERLLGPTQERVALAVALELELRVPGERVGDSGEVGDDRVIDHEIDGNARFDAARVAAEPCDGVAHGGEIGDRGHTGEVLHEDARGHELELAPSDFLGGAIAVGERADVVGGDGRAVLTTEQVLEQHA